MRDTEGILQHTALDWNSAFREAERIADRHGAQTGARSGELLHVACAHALGVEDFCTFDRRHADLGRRTGWKVKTWR